MHPDEKHRPTTSMGLSKRNPTFDVASPFQRADLQGHGAAIYIGLAKKKIKKSQYNI